MSSSTIRFSLFGERATKVTTIVLFLHYAVFTVGYFIFADYNDHYRFFQKPLLVIVIPAIVVLAGALNDLRKHPLFGLVVTYMIYMVVSSTWSTPFSLYEAGQKLTNGILILFFIVITHLLRVRYPLPFDRMLRFSVGVAAVSAIVSLFVFYQDHSFPLARATGTGSLSNVNALSNVYAAFALLAMGYCLKASSWQERALYVLPVICVLCFIWFGQSRTALASLFVALLLLVLAGSRPDRFRTAVFLFGIVGMLLVAFPEVVEVAWMRGGSFRSSIWGELLREVANKPIFGHGINSRMGYHIGEETFVGAHSAYLQTLWSGGVIGLALQLSVFASALWQAWRLGQEQGNYVLLAILVFAMGAMVTGVDTLVYRTADQWMIFWFPLALLMSEQIIATQVRRQKDA